MVEIRMFQPNLAYTDTYLPFQMEIWKNEKTDPREK